MENIGTFYFSELSQSIRTYVHRRASNHLADPSSLVSLQEGAAELSFTARIEGAHSDRAASASKKDGPVAPSPFQACSFHSHRNGTRVGPTARNVLTRPPTGTPRRAISPSEALLLLKPLLRGVAKAALYCTHRATLTF